MTRTPLRLRSEIVLDSSGVLSVRHGLNANLRAQPWQAPACGHAAGCRTRLK